jgi:diguanylate cyclase (GGDEF)-like protein
VYLLIVLAAALTLGLRPCFALAALASALYVALSSVALIQLMSAPETLRQSALRLGTGSTTTASLLDPQALLEWSSLVGYTLVQWLSRVWANLAALWLTAFVAGFFAQEAQRVRRAIQEAREQVERFSRIDWLTGLYNRRHFNFLLSQEISRSERYARPLSLLMVDSDNLKVANDTYGHQAGDQLLSTLAGLLRTESRLSDTIVRYGGDEFIMLLPDTDPEGAQFLAERLCAAIGEAEIVWEGHRIPLAVTVGLASLPQDASDAATLVARADAALYVGKRAGGNCVVTFGDAVAADPNVSRPAARRVVTAEPPATLVD